MGVNLRRRIDDDLDSSRSLCLSEKAGLTARPFCLFNFIAVPVVVVRFE